MSYKFTLIFGDTLNNHLNFNNALVQLNRNESELTENSLNQLKLISKS